MGDILFLAHRIPYPPDKGDKIRAWHMLRRMTARARVHLGAFVDDPADWHHAAKLRAICGDVVLRPLGPLTKPARAACGFLRGEPLSVAVYRDPIMRRWVDDLVRRKAVDRIFVFSSQMAPYALPHARDRRVVMDFVDIDSAKWQQYASGASPVKAALYAREARRLAEYERLIADKVHTSLFVSEAEADLFRGATGHPPARVRAVHNGVDTGAFQPGAVEEPMDLGRGPSLVFAGTMDYRPNIDAVLWFVRETWPLVRERHPSARFFIVGAKPTAEVRRLEDEGGVAVTGRVPDVRPYLAAADVVVAPVRIARGIQNKVLEAMAMAKPVVATSAAFEGIDAVPGVHLIVEDQPRLMADRILALIANRHAAQQLGQAARRQVVARYDWEETLASLDEMMNLAADLGNRAATA